MADLKKHMYRRKRKEQQPKETRTPNWRLIEEEVEKISSQYDELKGLDVEGISTFDQLPLSHKTKKGLDRAQFTKPTEIQRSAIPLALLGNDILGAAKTGSGKTLAFLVPLLEVLWRHRWSSIDGMGALIISPTRELAYQTFEVLKKVGKEHDFSAGLVIGGKNIQKEQDHIHQTNIVVCTPGRLLQHMDETPNFECSNLQVLVLDEADRILDLGFEATMAAVLQNLPKQRQTFLFSATQTKSIRDLARLSLKDPQYVAVHEQAVSSTPSKLTQSYIVCELPSKLNTLYSFIRMHSKLKLLVFFSSCKQVKFAYEAFRRMRPGVPLMALYGKQKQVKRMGIYDDFCQRKSAVLLATDIAARGLDFPSIHWVIQVDCPEDANSYIHRVGRTARYEKDGAALLFLLPSEEEGMLKALEAKKVPINKIEVNPKKVHSIQKSMDNFCAADQEMQHWAKKTLVSYVRSVFLQQNKSVFDVNALPIDAFATSLGLSKPPRIRFLRKAEKKRGQPDDCGDGEEGYPHKASHRVAPASEDELDDSDCEEEGDSDADDGVDGLLTVKQVHRFDDQSSGEESPLEEIPARRQQMSKKPISKINLAKKQLRKGIRLHTHVQFDSDEDEENDYQPLVKSKRPRKQSDLPPSAPAVEDEAEEEDVSLLQEDEALALHLISSGT